MREIKFRAWAKKTELMFEVLELKQNIIIAGYKHKPYHTRLLLSFEHSEIMQFTGLKDKNSKEIYEGDIVVDFESIDKYIVAWNKSWACFYLEKITNYNDTELEINDELILIGNVYENPGLMEKENGR